jgi:hypothetical protein
MSAWLGVASAEHVHRAVALGIAQLNHGKRGNLLKLDVGDTLVFYSPVQRMGDRIQLQHFTAIGEISDGEIWQADEGDFKPFRPRVRYSDASPVELLSVRAQLHLTAEANWGYQLRRGFVPLDVHDMNILKSAMSRSQSGRLAPDTVNTSPSRVRVAHRRDQPFYGGGCSALQRRLRPDRTEPSPCGIHSPFRAGTTTVRQPDPAHV